MGRLSARNQLIIAIAVIIVLTLVVILMGILPLFQDAATVSGEIDAERQNLAAAQALLARRQSAKAQAAANEVELMRIANQVPDSPQLPSVIIELQDIANASGVTLVSIAPGELAPPEEDEEGVVAAYSVVPVTILLQGDWADHIDFMRRIALLDRGVRVTSANATYVPVSDEEPAYVEAIVTIEVYVMASTVPGAPTATTPPAASTTPTQTP